MKDRAWTQLLLHLLFLWMYLLDLTRGLPDLRDNLRQHVRVFSGQDFFLTCIAKNLENNTVIWKRMRQSRPEVLTAGDIRVTSDSRVSVLHTPGGNEWVLSVSQARVSDSAQYVCEVNSSPTVKVYQMVTVTSMKSLPVAAPFALAHNFTECCLLKAVPEGCLAFCSLQNIVLGSTGVSSHDCEDHLASIAFCMADGRNHEPCCARERVPEACREVCRGEYTLQTASVLHHYACSHFSSATLACIAQGVELLPSPPRELMVEPLSDREIKVQWKMPKNNGDTVTHYVLNVTELKAFDESLADMDGPMGEEEEYFPADSVPAPAQSKIERQGRDRNFVEKFTEIKLNGTNTSTVLKDLKPYTMYEIYLISVNGHGTSLPTYRLRTLTLMPAADQPLQPGGRNDTAVAQQLPDVRGCCEKKGLPMENCVDRFCDPRQTDDINLTDMMICAPWVTITIPCLTQGQDHTPCCVQRGLPSLCLNLCHGNITRIDYQYFQCLPYMAIYANCLMEGYGVLTSAPRELIIKHLSSSWAVLHWESPEKLADTVVSYTVHFRSLSGDDGDGFYTAVPHARTPHLLSDLHPDANYEVYVRAVNQYGVSQASSRLLFRTEKAPAIASGADDGGGGSPNGYNMTECCMQSGVVGVCLPLCNFRARLSDAKHLVPLCLDDMHKMLRCGAGGRNHMPCCERRRVASSCLDMCAGFLSKAATSVTSACVGDLIAIVECMEEGANVLPGPVTDFRVLNVNSSAVHLEWEAPTETNVTGFEIHYEVWHDNRSEKVIRVNETSHYIVGLQTNEPYAFYVVAVNDFGSSVASSMVHLNLSYSSEGDVKEGTPSPPEGLTLQNKNTTSLTLMWLPPAFTHPLDHLRYKLYYRIQNQSVPHSLTMTSLGVQLHDLVPGTEYEVFVTALTDKGESPPAETLSVWTDTAYPAYVEVPSVHPAQQLEEGVNVTVLCVAMGTPTPVVSVFVGGVLVAQEVTRHLVTVLPNITREQDSVTCHAENGHGPGWQASRKLLISYGPSIELAETLSSVVGRMAVITCTVSAYPEPHLAWWRDVKGEHQVVGSDRHLIKASEEEPGSYSTQLTIVNVTEEDVGAYYCHAENPYGMATEVTSLKVQEVPAFVSSVRDCCVEQRVASDCMDTCAYEVDVEAVLSRSKCIPEIHKLMYCAADGSDHRRCCLGWGVPRRCIGWCQGKAIHHGAMCVLVWSKQIISCFQEGRDLLPGPPRNIEVQQISGTEARVTWDPPLKNPNTVDYYRVSWKKTDPGRSVKFHNETHETFLIVSNVKSGAAYEFVVKAANRRGSSAPSSPVKVEMNGVAESLNSVSESEGDQVAFAVGLMVALLVLGIIGALAFLHYRQHLRKLPGGVSFENPSYMKDGTSDTVQIANCVETNGSVHLGDGWKNETLHAADPSYEVSGGTGHYEELKNEPFSGRRNSKDIL